MSSHTPLTSKDYYWMGAGGVKGTTGATSGSWDTTANWLVKVAGTTGPTGNAFSGDGYYFAPAVRTPHGGDRVWFEYSATQATIGIGVTMPNDNLRTGGWNGATWTGSASAVTADHSGPCSIRVQPNYDYPIGVTTGTGIVINADEVRANSDSNYEVVIGGGSSLGYVLSTGTHSLKIKNSTVHTIELRKSSSLNDTGQYGNFDGHGNTYNHAVNILGYASGRFTHIGGYGGSGGYIPYVNIAPAYRDTIKIDVDINKLSVAPSGTQTGHYAVVDPVSLHSSASNHRRSILTLVQSPENDTEWGQFIGTKLNNPVAIHCGCTIDNHFFGSGSIVVGSAAENDDEIVVVDGTITSNCKVNTIHPNNPSYDLFKIGDSHGNTVEGYLVTDDQGDAEFVFSRGHYVKAHFGNIDDSSSGMVSQSGGK